MKFLIIPFVLVSIALADTWYVAPNGSDNAAGTIDQPFATLQRAHDEVTAGDTVWIRGGRYYTETPAENDAGIILYKSGRSDTQRIYYWAYPGETPVFDFANLRISTSSYTHGIVVTGSWLHFKGLEITNVPMNINSNAGMYVRESGDNIFELMNFHHNNGTGVFVNGSKGTGGHLFLNCDSHDNYDPTGRQGDGQNADGFGVHYQTTGKMTVFRGCRAWWNSDDGWDFISQEVPVLVENSMAMGNGWANYGTKRPSDGNGNGFKAGSSKTGIRHIIRQCVAWKNRASGFYANHSSGGNDWFNNTSYANGTQYNMLASTWDANGNRTDGVILTGDKVHVMRNNIGYPQDNTNMQGVDSRNNTWDLNIMPRDNDFLSVEDPSMTITGRDLSEEPGMLGPRMADGSLPVTDFLKLSESSQMIDQVVDVNLPAIGLPDLGAWEFGLGSEHHDIVTHAGPGGTIMQSPAGGSATEGSSIEFSAVPLEGWEFVGWSGDYTGSESVYTLESLNEDVNLEATFEFVSTDSLNYEGENTKLNHAVVESEHLGFSGSGYANFDNVAGSSIEFSVVVSETGEQEVTFYYANGADNSRPVSVVVNGVEVLSLLEFPPTPDWDTWASVTANIHLDQGVNTVLLTSLQEDGGPNIDKMQIIREDPVQLAGNQTTHKDFMNASGLRADLKRTSEGLLLRLITGAHQGLNPGEIWTVQLYTMKGSVLYELTTSTVSLQSGVLVSARGQENGIFVLQLKAISGEGPTLQTLIHHVR